MRTEGPRLKREMNFHDRWAASINVDAINVDAVFEGATAPENRYILSRIGDVRGKYILDLGCGAGENSVYFARKGANCIAADYSPGMVQAALRLAETYDVSISGRIIDAMAIDFPEDTFDIVYAANLLHHVSAAACIREIYRVLKPGGMACIWDPLRHNPIINVYRRIAKGVRTLDERPLDIGIINDFCTLFSKVEYDSFWLSTTWIFIRFYFFERVNPNRERYWKKIIIEEPRLRSMYLRLEKFDRLLKKIGFLKRFSWNIVVVAEK
ncbi:MAG: class I SAM-dependent methyltransferase [Desulfobacterales bacterium]